MTNRNRHARRAWASAIKRQVTRGNVFHVEIHHDNECTIYGHTRLCSCSPDRVLKDDTGKTLAEVAGAGFYHPLEFAGAVQ